MELFVLSIISCACFFLSSNIFKPFFKDSLVFPTNKDAACTAWVPDSITEPIALEPSFTAFPTSTTAPT